jgi:iron complex outermembrane receptor protein
MFEDATDSYSMLDFRVSNRIQLSSDLALNVSVFGSNLLDEAARNHSSFVKNQVPLPGRSYGVKVYATF